MIRPALLIVDGREFDRQTSGDLQQHLSSSSTGGVGSSMGQWIVSTPPGRIAATLGRGLKKISQNLRPNSATVHPLGEDGINSREEGHSDREVFEDEEESLSLAHQVCQSVCMLYDLMYIIGVALQ